MSPGCQNVVGIDPTARCGKSNRRSHVLAVTSVAVLRVSQQPTVHRPRISRKEFRAQFTPPNPNQHHPTPLRKPAPIHRRHGVVIILPNTTSLLLHRIQHHHPYRAHFLSKQQCLESGLPNPPQDQPQHASKAHLHPWPALHPLHRQRRLRVPVLAFSRRSNLPRRRARVPGPAHPLRLPRRNQKAIPRAVPARVDRLRRLAGLRLRRLQFHVEESDGVAWDDGGWAE